jgi:hypothetical protein
MQMVHLVVIHDTFTITSLTYYINKGKVKRDVNGWKQNEEAYFVIKGATTAKMATKKAAPHDLPNQPIIGLSLLQSKTALLW